MKNVVESITFFFTTIVWILLLVLSRSLRQELENIEIGRDL